MNCDNCDEKATVFLTQIAGGEMKKVRLCEACAKEKGVSNPAEFSLDEFMQKGFEQISGGLPPVPSLPRKSGTEADCPDCGFSLHDFEKVRRFGCAKCYETFADELSLMLQGMHKGVKHFGKVPEKQVENQLQAYKRKELQAQLDEAVEAEDYEAAAAARDELKELGESK